MAALSTFFTAGYSFNTQKIQELAENENVITLAWILVAIDLIIEPLFSLLAGKPAGHSAFARYTNLTGSWLVLAVFVSTLLGTLGFIAIFYGLLQINGSVPFSPFIRILAISMSWRYLSALGILFSGIPKTAITGLFYFIYLIFILIAIRAYTKRSWALLLAFLLVAFLLTFGISVAWSVLLEQALGLTK